MRPFDLIIFDFDGTLADSATGIVACMEAAFLSFDLPPPPVGDTATDIQFAKNIGAASCWATYGYGDAGRCHTLQPTYRIADIRGLFDVGAFTALW